MEFALAGLFNNLHLLFRWLHVIAGITWIGLLYFFNFVNLPLQGSLDDAGKKIVNPQLMPRALWWFRWAAMVTFLVGVLYIIWKIYIATDAGLNGTGGLFTSTWGQWISFGGLLGTIMWFNVWFVIWPAQKKIIAGVKGTGPAADASVAAMAGLRSKHNVYMSVPLVFLMISNHAPVLFGNDFAWLIAAIIVLVAWVVTKLLYAKSGGSAPSNIGDQPASSAQ